VFVTDTAAVKLSDRNVRESWMNNWKDEKSLFCVWIKCDQ
jgi:hypothetical protein